MLDEYVLSRLLGSSVPCITCLRFDVPQIYSVHTVGVELGMVMVINVPSAYKLASLSGTAIFQKAFLDRGLCIRTWRSGRPSPRAEQRTTHASGL